MSEFELFMRNPFWQEMCDNAPAKVKQYFYITWENNSVEEYTEELKNEIQRIRGSFSKEDWDYVIKNSHGHARYEYTHMMKEKFPD